MLKIYDKNVEKISVAGTGDVCLSIVTLLSQHYEVMTVSS